MKQVVILMARYLSGQDIESVASRVLRAYKMLPEVQNSKIKNIDPSILLTSLLGLSIEYRHLSDTGQILGLTCFSEIEVDLYDDHGWFSFDGKTVLIEQTLKSDPAQLGRCNFTIAHEGCHHILKMLFPKDYGNGLDARRALYFRDSELQNYMLEESQVNSLASAILMPKFIIEEGMDAVGLPERIDILNRIWRKDEYDKFCKLALILGVSKQALAIRMKKLNLIGQNDLDNPYRIMDIFLGEGDFFD